MNLDMGPGSSPGPDITMALGGNQAISISQLLTDFTSSDMLLSTGNEPFSLYLSPIPLHKFAHHDNAYLPCARKKAQRQACEYFSSTFVLILRVELRQNIHRKIVKNLNKDNKKERKKERKKVIDLMWMIKYKQAFSGRAEVLDGKYRYSSGKLPLFLFRRFTYWALALALRMNEPVQLLARFPIQHLRTFKLVRMDDGMTTLEDHLAAFRKTQHTIFLNHCNNGNLFSDKQEIRN
ncbi:hypothetical protein H671_6g15201 [Cricetulus griseus]|nr:hypothetical protein H671_6g15201 [Cricetulus griseus]